MNKHKTLQLYHPLLRIITLNEHYCVTISLNLNASYVTVVDKFG